MQLPRRLARLLKECGHDVTHTFELPHRNATLDGVVRHLCDREGRILGGAVALTSWRKFDASTVWPDFDSPPYIRSVNAAIANRISEQKRYRDCDVIHSTAIADTDKSHDTCLRTFHSSQVNAHLRPGNPPSAAGSSAAASAPI